MDEPVATHADVTTMMRLLGEMQLDVERIRKVVEDNDEEETDESEADG